MSTPQRQQIGVFFQGGNQIIQAGDVIQHSPSVATLVQVLADSNDIFTHLRPHVATAAFDPQDKVDAPKCHPNTREAVLNEIMNWIHQSPDRVKWMLWLNGAAGAGKSAIARSIVELCRQEVISLAAFFFFRTDPTRNTIEPIVATLVYQLIQGIPELQGIITSQILRDPLIFTRSLDSQFNALIFEPLRRLAQETESQQTLVFIFDGIDELSGNDHQADLINIMANFVDTKVYPLIVLFGSRAENQLKQAFASLHKTESLLKLPLDNHYLPDNDIRLFLFDNFTKIRSTHPFGYLLERDWPTRAHVEEIVGKSSGQFIYASVVVKFLSAPDMHPAQQLDIVRGIRPTSMAPFAQLDALYRRIFSQVKTLPDTMHLLAAVILGTSDIEYLETMFPDHISRSTIPVLLAGLTSIISCNNTEIKFLHASLPDFLLDRTRSQEFYIDRMTWSTRFSLEYTQDPGRLTIMMDGYTSLLERAQPIEELRQRLTCVLPTASGSPSRDFPYLDALQKLNFGDGGKVYHHQLKHFTQYYVKKRWSGLLPELEQCHDIRLVMEEIKTEDNGEDVAWIAGVAPQKLPAIVPSEKRRGQAVPSRIPRFVRKVGSPDTQRIGIPQAETSVVVKKAVAPSPRSVRG